MEKTSLMEPSNDGVGDTSGWVTDALLPLSVIVKPAMAAAHSAAVSKPCVDGLMDDVFRSQMSLSEAEDTEVARVEAHFGRTLWLALYLAEMHRRCQRVA
jgi:hypothetical protein